MLRWNKYPSFSKKIGLRTDASAKFEKGLDPNTAIEAMNRACQLVEELGAGEVVGGVVDVYPNVKKGRKNSIRAGEIQQTAGNGHCKRDHAGLFPQTSTFGYDQDQQMRSWFHP